jgi:hypothetical protein
MALIGSLACSQNDGVATQQLSCASECVEGGSAVTGECSLSCDPMNSAQVCPQGSACQPHLVESCQGGLDSCRRYECRPVHNRLLSQPSALLESRLGTRSFNLEPVGTETGRPTFEWKPPAGAVAVVCAVFTCLPRILKVGTQDRRAVTDIVNMSDCAVAVAITRFGVDSFSADSGASYDPWSNPVPGVSPRLTCASQASSGTDIGSGIVPTELAAGCWAYDATDIVAATPLRPITNQDFPSDASALPIKPNHCAMHDRQACMSEQGRSGTCSRGTCVEKVLTRTLTPLVIRDCASEERVTDRVHCYRDEGASIGTCADGVCRQRCVDATDCEPDEDSNSLLCCQDARGGYLGLCQASCP